MNPFELTAEEMAVFRAVYAYNRARLAHGEESSECDRLGCAMMQAEVAFNAATNTDYWRSVIIHSAAQTLAERLHKHEQKEKERGR